MPKLLQTPSQTIGPFFHFALHRVEAAGAGLMIAGHIRDGEGNPVGDALLEFWSAAGFARAPSDACGMYSVKVAHPPARYLAVGVFARGLLRQLTTRLYMDQNALDADPDLRALPAARRRTLLAKPADEAQLSFDIWLQGPDETVFFAQ